MSNPYLETSAPLPRSNVLSYVATISSPTRVRRIARTGMRLVAIWYALMAATCCVIAVAVARSELRPGMPWSGLVILMAVPLVPAALATACGIGQWLLANAVEHGSTIACRFANIMLVPAVLATLFATLPAVGLTIGLNVDPPPGPVILWHIAGITCGLMIPILITAALLITDLSKCLKWIATNPAAEKPPFPLV